MNKKWKIAVAAFASILLVAATPAGAAPKKDKPQKPVTPVQPVPVPGPGDDNSAQPDGTWLLDVAFDAGFAFQDLLTLHKNGTVTENNSILNAASGANAPFYLVGADGQGTWDRDTGGRVSIQFHKMVFCGTLPAAQPPAPAPEVPCLTAGRKAGEFLGYLRTRISADITGDRFDSPKGQGETVLIIGSDPLAAPAVNYGPSSVVGERLAHPDKTKDAS
jgi:hypothetical protein